MEIIDFYASDNKDHWLAEIQKSDWRAGKYLYELLRDQKLKELCGETTQVLLLIDNDKLLAFCTYAEQDDIREPSLTPWVGFVYTFPKYGYRFWKEMKDVNGEDSRVYITDIVTMDYSTVLGTTVSGTIDRPLGSAHPRHPEMIYPINYGYVDGVFAGDGAEQDVYVFGTDQPLDTFTGKVIGVYHRLNDNEDKWIVSLSREAIPTEDILNAIGFQEQYFMGELYTL